MWAQVRQFIGEALAARHNWELAASKLGPNCKLGQNKQEAQKQQGHRDKGGLEDEHRSRRRGLTQLWKAAKSMSGLAWSAIKSWPVC